MKDCGCKKSDGWRCAVDQNLTSVSCSCECHLRTDVSLENLKAWVHFKSLEKDVNENTKELLKDISALILEVEIARERLGPAGYKILEEHTVLKNQVKRFSEATKNLLERIYFFRSLLRECLPTLIWFHSGPYGASPDPKILDRVREVLGD